jgi:hypothetical protein
MTALWPIRSRRSSVTRHSGVTWSTGPDCWARRARMRFELEGMEVVVEQQRSSFTSITWLRGGAQPGDDHLALLHVWVRCGRAEADEQAFSPKWDRDPDGIARSSTTDGSRPARRARWAAYTCSRPSQWPQRSFAAPARSLPRRPAWRGAGLGVQAAHCVHVLVIGCSPGWESRRSRGRPHGARKRRCGAAPSRNSTPRVAPSRP